MAVLDRYCETPDEDDDESQPLLQPHPSRLHPANRPTFPEPEPTDVGALLHQRLEEIKDLERRTIKKFRLFNCFCCGATDQDEMAEQTHLAPPATGTDNRSTQSKKSSKGPIIEENGLSIVERVFFKSAPGKPQVIMGIMLRLRVPPVVKELRPERIVDLIRLAQARHYRLSSYVDPNSMTCHLLAENAKDLPCNYRFIERKTKDTWRAVYEQEVNTNFDTADTTRPLCRNAIILPKELMPHKGAAFAGASELSLPEVTVTNAEGESASHVDESDKGKKPQSVEQSYADGEASTSKEETRFGHTMPPFVPNELYFEIMFTFHHCLGDGLSMFAFARTFLENVQAEKFNADDIHLENVLVNKEPPPVLDNLLNPNFFEILPAAGSMALSRITKKGRRFKGHKTEADKSEPKAVRPTAVVKADAAAGGHLRSPSPAPSGNSGHEPNDIPAPDEVSVPRPLKAYTRVRFLWFDAEFISSLRKKSKSEGTTIAAVLVVAALAAVRTSFATLPKYQTKPLPTHQGWVVTNSIRHILPQSRLLQGGDRESDEGMKMFGGYAGSVTNSSLKLIDTSDVWERCRSVRKSIATSFRVSIQRSKLMNYCYKHPKLWSMIESRVDLAKMSRSFSVEVANLGAWECPSAPPDAGPEDTRLRLEHFGGVVNSSFDGVRGLFTLGVITLGGAMSVAVGYDVASVHEEDAESFVNAFTEGLKRLNEAKGKVSVLDIRTLK
ncbi:hypothetical protein HDU76_001203 [Blyttiomyces sp. JEL0837]|nr:hypothetical protein HDU76_001203 [Blyttiomyces sp. JEL0837]